MRGTARWLVASAAAALALHACSLDWDLPDETGAGAAAGQAGASSAGGGLATGGGGAGGGSSFDPLCCKLCHPAPAQCTVGQLLDLPPSGDGACDRFYFQGDGCVPLIACDCNNCGELPQSQNECMAWLQTHCNGCAFDN